MSGDRSDGKSPSIPICQSSAVVGMEPSVGLQQNLESDRECEANPERQNSSEETISAMSESEDATFFQPVLLKELFYETRNSRMPQAKSVRNQSDDSAASATDASYKQSQEEEEKLPSKFECELYSYLLPYFSSDVGKVKTPCVNLEAEIVDGEELLLIFSYKDKKAVKIIIQVYKDLLKNLKIREIDFDIKSDTDLFKFVERKNCLRGWGTNNSHVYISTCATEQGRVSVFGFDDKSIDEAEQWIKSHVSDSGITSKTLPALVQQSVNNKKKNEINPTKEKQENFERSAVNLEIGSNIATAARAIESMSVNERKSLSEENRKMKSMPDHQIERDSETTLSIMESDLCGDDSQEKSDQALLEAAAIVNTHWIKKFGNWVVKRSCDKNHVKIMESQDSSGKSKIILKGTLIDLLAVQKALDKHAKMITSELSNEIECSANSAKSKEVISEQTDKKENLANKKVAEDACKGARRKEYKTLNADESNHNQLGNLEASSLPFIKSKETNSEETVTSETFDDAVEDLSALNKEAVFRAEKTLNSGLGMIGSVTNWFSGSEPDYMERETSVDERSASAAAFDKHYKEKASCNSISFNIQHYEYLAPFITETVKKRNVKGYSMQTQEINNTITLSFSSKSQSTVKEVLEIHRNWQKQLIAESTLICRLFEDQIWMEIEENLKLMKSDKVESINVSREVADEDYMRVIVFGLNEQKVKSITESILLLNARYISQIYPQNKSADDQHLVVDNMQASTCPAMAHRELNISDFVSNSKASQIQASTCDPSSAVAGSSNAHIDSGFATGPSLAGSHIGLSATSSAAAPSAILTDYGAVAAASSARRLQSGGSRPLDNRPQHFGLILKSISLKSRIPELHCVTSLLNINIHVLLDNVIKPTKIKDSEVVICPSDSELHFNGGLSALIIREAGDKIKLICRNHIKQYGVVPVSRFVCTSSGNLARNYNMNLKYILHVNGPYPTRTSFNFISNQEELLKLTSDTYFNCLCYIEFTLGLKRIVFPAVGAGTLAVPIEWVVQSFVDALRRFEEKVVQNSSTRNIRDIYLVSNEEPVAREMIQRIQGYATQQ